LQRELLARGVKVNRKRVARLMREAGLKAKGKRRFKATTQSKHRYPVAPNVVERRFEVQAANRLWVSDITYVWTDEGWLYVAIVLDAWSRRVVGWAWSVSLEADFAVRALKMAVRDRRPQAGWMHHSDQGSGAPPGSCVWGLSAGFSRRRCSVQHEPQGGLLGQRLGRELLWHFEKGVDSRRKVPNQAASRERDFRVH